MWLTSFAHGQSLLLLLLLISQMWIFLFSFKKYVTHCWNIYFFIGVICIAPGIYGKNNNFSK